MEYKIVCEYDNSSNRSTGYVLSKLEEKVNYLMDRGWKPQGGVSISVAPPHSHPNVHYKISVAQALVKED